MNPILTVLMPIGRVDDFLFVAINSLKQQVFDKFICYILISNPSDDDFRKLNIFISNDNRFRIYALKLSGISFALNYGINITNTKYVARMDGDDISHPLRFIEQINYLEQNPSCVVVGCGIDLIDEMGTLLKQKFKFFGNNDQIRRALKYRMPLCHPSLIFKTEILVKMKGYLYGNSSEDHELFLRIARDYSHEFKNLPQVLFSYRRHRHQLTHKNFSKKAFSDISGFLFTEFLLTYNPLYIVGIFANHPILRECRSLLRRFHFSLIKFKIF